MPDTRERILSAARHLFHSRGFNAVGITEICRAADVVKGSFYHFFDGKQALLESVVERNAQELFARLAELDAEVLSGREKLLALLHGTAEKARLQKRGGAVLGCDLGNLAVELNVYNEGARRVTRKAFRRWLRELEQLVAAGIEDGSLPPDLDRASTAASLLAVIQGLSTLGRTLNDPAQLEAVAGLAATQLLPQA